MDALDFSNKQFKLAADFIRYTDEFIFLTGKAGTGKTTFLKYIKDRCEKNYILTAPTGVAAINAGGVTLHSFFQLPLGTYIADYRKQWGDEDSFIINRHQLLSQIRIASSKRKLMREMELLIIDEISMVRADTLDMVDTLLRHIRQRPDAPFGGVQLLFIGDLYQLPPVVKNHELQLLSEYYRSPFFFDAHCLQEQKPICVELETIYRQDDPEFIRLLNNIRNNSMDEDDYRLLAERRIRGYVGGAGVITLTSHNYQADEINQTELAGLPGPTYTLKAKVSGEFPETAYPIEPEIELKVGAQIMFTKNDKGEVRRYYNGKIGTVNRIDIEKNEVEIYFPKEKTTLTVQPEKWENIRYKLNEDKNKIEEDVVGVFEQFPFRLAWAVTIHKSQGLTFDEAIIDAGRSFAPGQVYVALSRLTSLKGVVLQSAITPASIQTDPRIVDYMSSHRGSDRWEERLALGKKQFLLNKSIDTFGWTHFILRLENYLEESVSILTKDVVMSSPIYRDGMGYLKQLEQVGRDFASQIYNLYVQGQYDKLSERIQAAEKWMNEILEKHLIQPWNQWRLDLGVIKGGAKAATVVRYLVKQLKSKQVTLQAAVQAVKILAQTTHIDKALEALHPDIREDEAEESISNTKSKKVKSAEITLDMFKNQKMSIEEIAEKRGMVRSTIVSHLAQSVGEGEIQVEDILPAQKVMQILDVIKQNPNASGIGYLKGLLPEDVQYEDIRLVLAHHNRKKQ